LALIIAEKVSDEVLSIPMNPFLTNEQLDFVAYKISENNKFTFMGTVSKI
jgi:dTDP-4-amino-4,6-dideoxygalactose transaminase